MSFYNSQKAVESLSRKYSSTKVSPKKKKKKAPNKQKKTQPLIRQKGWGNNIEEWSSLQEVLLLFLSPQIKTILHYVSDEMTQAPLVLCNMETAHSPDNQT